MSVAEAVTVVGFTEQWFKLQVRSKNDEGVGIAPEVWLNDEHIGFLPRKRDRQDKMLHFWLPKIIRVRTFLLSNGRELKVASKPLFIRNLKKEHVVFFPTKVTVGGVVHNYDSARKHVRVGCIAERHQPLQLKYRQGILTNGSIDIPLQRPEVFEWRQHEIIRNLRTVSKGNWKLMLSILHGLKIEEILEVCDIKDRVIEEKTTRKRIKRAEECLEKKYGECFFGNKKPKTVAIGRVFVFSFGNHCHVVDAPENGVGLYFFEKKDDAIEWASRKIDFREARKRAFYMNHAGDWRERAENVFQLMTAA